MKGTPQSLSLSAPNDRGHLIIPFGFKENDKRITVAQKYGSGLLDYGRFDDHIIAGVISETGEDLVLAPQFALCTLGRATEPRTRPAADHVNNPLIMELINAGRPQ